MSLNNNPLVAKFLEARALIDRDTAAEVSKGKEKKNVMEKPTEEREDNVRSIIEAKPSKKKIIEFLKRKVAQYTDATSDSDF
jgi:hypothetical protein